MVVSIITHIVWTPNDTVFFEYVDLNLSAREEIQCLTKLNCLFESRSSVENFDNRESAILANALARFALQLQMTRRDWFRQLSTEPNERALAAKSDVV